MFVLIKDIFFAIKLDVFKMDYVYSEEKFQIVYKMAKEVMPKHGVILRVLAYLKKTVLSLYQSRNSSINFNKAELLFFSNTKNQQVVIEPIYNRISDKSIFVGRNKFGKIQFPEFWAYMISFLFLPIYIYRIISSSKYIKDTIPFYFDKYLFNYGYFVMWKCFLRKIQPNVIIVANDHVGFTNCLILAGRSMGIKSVYIQHSSVSEMVPKLEFDFAFLDGQDALEKYSVNSKNSLTKIFLTGGTKYKFADNIKKHNNLGISIGIFDDFNIVAKIIQFLSLNLSLNIYIRPHTADNRYELFRKLAKNNNCFFSDSKNQKAVDFLKNMKINISAESSIHLEAALTKTIPIYFSMGNYINYDYYGYIKSGLVTSVPKTLEDLVCKIEEHLTLPYYFNKCVLKYFHASFGTIYFGKENELMVEILSSILLKDNSFKNWQYQENDFNMVVYNLNDED